MAERARRTAYVVAGVLVGLFFTASAMGLPWFMAAPIAALYGVGMYLYSRPDAPESEAIEPEEPVDACEHQTAPAEPIEVDWDGNGVPEVIGWLCVECGAKVSHRAAFRRNNPEPDLPDRYTPAHVNRLRQMLTQVQRDLTREVNHWKADGGEFHITENQYQRYRAAVDEAKRIKAILVEAEDRARRMRESGVQCKGWVEVSGHAPGSVVRRYAVPGECLCGGCEFEEVRAHGSDLPTRRVLSTAGEVEPEPATTYVQAQPPWPNGSPQESETVWMDSDDQMAYRWDTEQRAWVQVASAPILGATINTASVSITPDGLRPR